MSVLVDKNTRLLVQGITGSVGGFHARQCMEYGTNVVAGVTPGKGGQMFDGKVPVFDTVWEARRETGCGATITSTISSSSSITIRARAKRTAGVPCSFTWRVPASSPPPAA